MKYLLIGGKGFVSSNFQSLLKKKGKPFSVLSSKKIDLLSTAKCKSLSRIKKDNYNVVFFSAITPDKGRDFKAFRNNILMLSNFLEHFPSKNISHFNYISSDAVYSLNQKIINENTTCAPDDLYGAMHFSREKIVESFFNNNNYTIFRPTLIYGEGDTHGSYGPNRFLRQIKENNKIILFGKGLDTRDHIHIEDVVDLIFKISGKRSEGIFNLATGNSHSFLSVAKKFKKHDKNINLEFINNNNKPSKRKFDIRKLKKFKSKFLNIDIGINKYF